MTLRAWHGTLVFPELLNPLRNPGYAFALWSHKLLRFLSPVFLLTATAAAVGGAVSGSWLFQTVSTLFGLFYAVGLLGWWCEARRMRAPFVGTPYSFLLANLGFLVGTLRAILGYSVVRYR